MPRRLMKGLAGVAVGLGFLVSACSSSPGTSQTGNGPGTTSKTTETSLSKLVPATYRSRGYLVMATDPTIGAPFASFAPGSHDIAGLDVDLANAVGKALGLNVQLQNVTFDNFIPGLAAGRYDFSVSTMLDTKKREQQVNFVDFIHDGSGFLVKNGSQLTDLTLGRLCGLTVSAIQGSVEAMELTSQSQKCQSEGKKPVNVLVFAQSNQALLAVSSGRSQAFDGSSDINAWIHSQPASAVEQSGPAYGMAIDGMAIGKSSGLTKPIQQALQQLLDNGSYLKILKKYGVQNYALAKVTVNNVG
jgi:polar amino acid transport system substrate-binding protein